MPFIRVKSPVTGHEFDVAPSRLAAHPEWVVVDADPVKVARATVHGKPGKVKAKVVEVASESPADIEPDPFADFSESSAPETD